ncbi:MAG: biotin transporter BioY [Clostridiales bacterium]|jgi:biotin transport system substrate-specific component|nr:biotin transporter BioY [Clostridiales bacterium]
MEKTTTHRIKKTTTYRIAVYALFTAIIAICAQLLIPTAPVPITLGLFAILLVGALLGEKHSLVPVAVYIAIGLIGIPVFAGFKGGFSVLLGYTGGYVVGYLFTAFLTGLGIKLLRKKFGEKIWIYPVPMIVGVLACYLLGSAWVMLYFHRTLADTLKLCVTPFIIGDAIKIVFATVIAWRLKPLLKRELEKFFDVTVTPPPSQTDSEV